MRLPSIRTAPVVAVGLALVLAAGLLGWRTLGGDQPIRLTADFTDTTGVYVGNDVQYLGVDVGEITEVEPRGTTMRVHMELGADTRLPADAGAQIMQTSLITDRVVELGPAYTEGPALESGAHIGVDHTRAPATIDEIARTVDDLVVALDRTTPEGHDVGDLLSVTADNLDGNGKRIREAVVDGTEALRRLNAHGGEARKVVDNLARLTHALAERDATIRSFTSDLAAASDVVAEHRGSITSTLRALEQLSTVVAEFARKNRDVVGEDLTRAVEIAKVVRKHQDSLAEAFDTMPTLAENMTRAYDTSTQRLRVQFAFTVLPFSRTVRASICEQFAGDICHQLFRKDGSGSLDPLLDGVYGLLPKDFP